jgi:hypothetical protein
MSSSQIAPPRLPEAPSEYSQQHMQDLIRALEVFIEQERNPGELRGTRITLTDLPTSATGLETGALYNDAGTVKVA